MTIRILYCVNIFLVGTPLAAELPPSWNTSIAVICSLLILHLNHSRYWVPSIPHPSFATSLICLGLFLPLGAARRNCSIRTCDKQTRGAKTQDERSGISLSLLSSFRHTRFPLDGVGENILALSPSNCSVSKNKTKQTLSDGRKRSGGWIDRKTFVYPGLGNTNPRGRRHRNAGCAEAVGDSLLKRPESPCTAGGSCRKSRLPSVATHAQQPPEQPGATLVSERSCCWAEKVKSAVSWCHKAGWTTVDLFLHPSRIKMGGTHGGTSFSRVLHSSLGLPQSLPSST